MKLSLGSNKSDHVEREKSLENLIIEYQKKMRVHLDARSLQIANIGDMLVFFERIRNFLLKKNLKEANKFICEAFQCHRRAWQINPFIPAFLNGYGHAHYRAGNYIRARLIFLIKP